MQKIQLTKNLWLHEYIDKETYITYMNAGRLHRLPWKLDKRLVMADQMLRDKFGSVTINNWMAGENRNWSGLRNSSSSYWSKDSSHSTGFASDKLFALATAEEVRDYIKKNWILLGIASIELGVSWVHSDTRYIPMQKELMTYRP